MYQFFPSLCGFASALTDENRNTSQPEGKSAANICQKSGFLPIISGYAACVCLKWCTLQKNVSDVLNGDNDYDSICFLLFIFFLRVPYFETSSCMVVSDKFHCSSMFSSVETGFFREQRGSLGMGFLEHKTRYDP